MVLAQIEVVMHVQERDSPVASDGELLARYAREGDQEAFSALVRRHVGWVHAAAFRQLHDTHLAEDATQAVFVLLCRRSKGLANRKVSGWLFMAVNYTVRSMKRTQRRRRMHETLAALEQGNMRQTPPKDEALALKLDAAVARLRRGDRAVILLRFYRGLDYPQVAAELGMSEPAARKRVTRAIGKLRGKLQGDLHGDLPGKPCAEISAESLADAAIVGMPSAIQTLSSHITTSALTAAAGGTISTTVAAAASGAASLMLAAKVKAIVLAALMAFFATASTGAVIWEMEKKPGRSAAETSTMAVPDTRSFEEIYGLRAGETLRHIAPPFSKARSDYLRARNADSMAMIMHWKDGQLDLFSYFGSNQIGGYVAFEITASVLQIPYYEIECPSQFRLLAVPGDFVVRPDASRENLRAALETVFTHDAHFPCTLTFRTVPRPVTVLSGTWQYHPLAGQPATQANTPPVIELLGDGPGDGGTSTTSFDTLESILGNWLGRQVIFTITNPPESIAWHLNNPSNPRLRNRDFTDAVLRHLSDQTGLTLTEETRPVERLIVEPAH